MPPSCRTRIPISASHIESLEGRQLFSQTLQVLNTNFWGNNTLHGALDAAQAGDTIDMTAVHGTITLDHNTLITNDLTIIGPGADLLNVTMATPQVFDIAGGTNVKMSGFTIDGVSSISALGTSYFTDLPGGAIRYEGFTGQNVGSLTLTDMAFTNNVAFESGGAISASFCDVTMTRCRVAGNTALNKADALGGGVFISNGSLIATDCTFDDNSAEATGDTDGTIYNRAAFGGGVCLMGDTGSTFTNCTFAHNATTANRGNSGEETVEAYGGAIALFGDGNFTMINCTLADNSAGGTGADSFGGGMAVYQFGATDVERVDTLKIVNTVMADNTADTGPDAYGLDVSAVGVTNVQSNILSIGDDSGIVDRVANNRAGTAAHPLDARLADVTDNGGPVPTMMPLAGSPVLGVADANEVPRRDARGYPRSAAYDVGAVERQANYSPGLDVWPNTKAVAGSLYSTRVAASDVDGNPITLSLNNAPAWLSFTDHGDGTATLAGTPTESDAGKTSVTLRASDGLLEWDETFTLTIKTAPALMSSTGLLQITGTDAAEVIHVWQPRGTGTTIRVTIGRKVRNYDPAAVTAIQIFAMGGDDTVVANCIDLGSYVNAGDGNDTVVGGALADSLTGGTGDDTELGLGGNDWIDGNSGRDNLQGGDGADRIYGGNGRDVIDGGAGSDVLYGEVGPDLFITKDRTRDWIFGGEPLINYVQGDAGKDILYDAVAA